METTLRQPILEARGVARTYPLTAEKVEALRGVDVTLAPGELVALVGASGSGKTTLLNLLGCLDRPDAGTVRVQGTEVHDLSEHQLTGLRRKAIGFVFQEAYLIPTLTALENVGLPLAFDRGRIPHTAPSEALGRVGLADKTRRYPNELSGGERQRVAIARAIVHQPVLLLADEPTGNLDSENGRRIFALFRDLVSKGDLSALVATHNRELAALTDRRIYLKDGRIVQGEGA
jgi:putative ABC transport system ATP-binding protein